MKAAGQIALLFLLLLVYLSAAPALLMAQPDFSALDINPKWNGASYDPGVLRFCDSTAWPASTDCVGVSAAANSAAYDVRLPVDTGTAGQVLSTDGNNPLQLSWASNSPGACPAGATGELQYNTSGACDSTPDFKITGVGGGAGLLVTLQSDVVSPVGRATLKLIVFPGAGNQSGGGRYQGFAPGGTAAAPTATKSGSIGIRYDAQFYDGSAYSSGAQLRLIATQDHTPSAQGTAIEFYTKLQGQTSLARRWQVHSGGHWLPSSDVYDIGTLATPVRNGYSKTWNTQELQVENTGKTSHWELDWDNTYLNFKRTDGATSLRLTNADHKALFTGPVAAEHDLHLLTDSGLDQWIWTTNVSDHLELKEVGGGGVVFTFDAAASKLNIGSSYRLVTQAMSVASQDITCQGAAGCDLLGPWGDIDMRGFLDLESPNSQTAFRAEAALGGGDANTGAWQIYNAAGDARVRSWVTGDNGSLSIWNDAGNLTAGLSAEGTMGGADAGYLYLKDGSNNTKIDMGVDGGSNPIIRLFEDVGTDVVIQMQNSSVGGGGARALFNNEVGTQRILVDVHNSGAAGRVIVNQASGDSVTMTAGGVDGVMGFLIGALSVFEKGTGARSGSCTSSTDALYWRTDGAAGTMLYGCIAGTWTALH